MQEDLSLNERPMGIPAFFQKIKQSDHSWDQPSCMLQKGTLAKD
jgi:hypothetical protein